VSVLNELARQVPEGVYLRSVKQTGSRLNVVGFAQSGARVSNLMRNLEGSPLFGQPVLVEIRAATQNNRSVNQFILDVDITRPKPEDQQAAGGTKS
jgi:type IV pilus assembly protein PilN